MADLHPIVIPRLKHVYKSITYECAGEGLYKYDWLYDAHPPIPPKATKPGVAGLTKKPVAYWKAQCAFRGLNQTGAIADLQLRLREAKKPMLPELKDAEKQLNKEFRKTNKTARDGNWKLLKTPEEKAAANPQKFLAEIFPKGSSGRPANLDIVVVKVSSDDRLKLSDEAEKMGLEAVSVEAPWTGNKQPSPNRWVVIGRTRDGVWEQMKTIERETSRSKQNLLKEKTTAQKPPAKLSKEKASSQKPPAKLSKEKAPAQKSPPEPGTKSSGVLPKVGRTKQTARKTAFSSDNRPSPAEQDLFGRYGMNVGNAAYKMNMGFRAESPASSRDVKPNAKSESSTFNVCGSYVVQCPHIEEQWGGPDLKLDIYLETYNGKQQFFAIFYFRALEGIMRFEKPAPTPKKEKKEDDDDKKRKWEEDDEGDFEMDDIDPYESESPPKYDNKIFTLSSGQKPTARRPVWRYRWRGRETGCEEIMLGSDREVRTIKFTKKGMGLEGSFTGGVIGDCRFTGVKVSSEPPWFNSDPDTTWMGLDEHTWDHERQRRW